MEPTIEDQRLEVALMIRGEARFGPKLPIPKAVFKVRFLPELTRFTCFDLET